MCLAFGGHEHGDDSSAGQGHKDEISGKQQNLTALAIRPDM